MRRVLILGCSDSGKSTLARVLGERFKLPVIHLDAHYWRPGWVEPSKEEWRRQALELVERPAWVMDGNYSITFPERFAVADLAILFDFPTWLCFWRILKRIATSYGRTRPDMAQGCPEHIDLKFFRYVLGFRSKQRPRLLATFETFAGPKVVFTRPSEVERWLDTRAPQLPRGSPAS